MSKKVRRSKKSRLGPFRLANHKLIRITTKNSGHRHKWMRVRKFTSVVRKHRHKINFKRKIALPVKRGGHAHRLRK